jgi:hypothetical protein
MFRKKTRQAALEPLSAKAKAGGPCLSTCCVATVVAVAISFSIALPLCFIAYQLSIVTPHVREVGAFLRAHESQLEGVVSFAGSVQSAASELQLLSGSVPILANNVLTADWGLTAENVTRILKSISEATRPETRPPLASMHTAAGHKPVIINQTEINCYGLHRNCPVGQYCDRGDTCYTCSYIGPGQCDAFDNDCCSSEFQDQCPGDPYQCDLPPRSFLDDITTATSFGASITVKLMDLVPATPPEESADGVVGSAVQESAGGVVGETPGDGRDGGLLLSFIGNAAQLLQQQFDPAQWHAASDACLRLVEQLEAVDYEGFYYCRDNRATGCRWDANMDFRDRPTAVLPQVKKFCRSVHRMTVNPGVPSQCRLSLDAICGYAKAQGVANCLECYARNDEQLTKLGCERDDALEFCGF